MFKNYTKFLAIACTALLQFSCSKDDDSSPDIIAIDIPTTFEVPYGEEIDIDLSGVLPEQRTSHFLLTLMKLQRYRSVTQSAYANNWPAQLSSITVIMHISDATAICYTRTALHLR